MKRALRFDPRFAMDRAQGCFSLVPLTPAQAGSHEVVVLPSVIICFILRQAQDEEALSAAGPGWAAVPGCPGIFER